MSNPHLKRKQSEIRVDVNLVMSHLFAEEEHKALILDFSRESGNELPNQEETRNLFIQQFRKDWKDDHGPQIQPPDSEIYDVVKEASRVSYEMQKIVGAIEWLCKGNDKFHKDMASVDAQERKLQRIVIQKYNSFCRKWPRGLISIARLSDLVFYEKQYECAAMDRRIFVNAPCGKFMKVGNAMQFWQRLQRNTKHTGKMLTYEEMLHMAVMDVVVKESSNGFSSIDVEAMEPNPFDKSKSRPVFAYKVACALLKEDEFTQLAINDMTSLSLTKATNVLQTWIKKKLLCDEDKLLNLSIPLSLQNGHVLYSKLWLEMEMRMLSKLRTFFPKESVDASKADEATVYETDVCSICLQPFSDSAPSAKLTCGHVFHRSCCEAWFKSSKARACPMCRSDSYFDCLQSGEFDEFVRKHNETSRHKLSDEQLRALKGIINNKKSHIAIINGAAGTGKTELVSLLAAFELHIQKQFNGMARSVFVAPTGTAAMNMSDRLPTEKFQVNSIHSWILAVLNAMENPEGGNNGISGNLPFLFVDEAGMVSTWLLAAVLDVATKLNVKKIVLMGDRFQLPPVGGAGSVFSSACLSTNRTIQSCVYSLTKSFRTEIPGINYILQRIREVMEAIEKATLEGQPLESIDKDVLLKREDFEFSDDIGLIEIDGDSTQESVVECVKQTLYNLKNKLEQQEGESPRLGDDACVLSSLRTDTLLLDDSYPKNSDYQEILTMFNPRRASRSVKSKQFIAGDAVLCRTNVKIDSNNGCAPKLVLGNGTQGKVKHVQYRNDELESMVVDFNGLEYKFPVEPWYRDESPYHVDPSHLEDRQSCKTNVKNVAKLSQMFRELALANIQTVHKYQGSQKKHVVTAMYCKKAAQCDNDSFNTMNLLYTAASRAQRQLRFVFDKATLIQFLTNPTVAPVDRVLLGKLNALI